MKAPPGSPSGAFLWLHVLRVGPIRLFTCFQGFAEQLLDLGVDAAQLRCGQPLDGGVHGRVQPQRKRFSAGASHRRL